jgi:heat shock protein HtpX
MPDRLRRERFLRQLQTVAVIIAMALLFAVTGFVLLGTAGLAILIGAGFLLLIFVGQREIRVDTSQAQRIEPHQHEGLHAALDELTEKAELEEKPEPFLVPVEEMNAATMGKETQPVLAITMPMLRDLTDRELRAIVAHEVMHLAQHDLSFFRLVMILQILTISVSRVGWLLLILFWPLALAGGAQIPPLAIALLLGAPVGSVLLQAALSRSREYAADLGAVALTKDPEALASALEKIDRRREQLWRQVLPVPQRQRRGGSILRTHPAQEQRIQKLREIKPSVSS